VLRTGAGGGESQLCIVETNEFKNLTHLALRLRPGSDAAVKEARPLF